MFSELSGLEDMDDMPVGGGVCGGGLFSGCMDYCGSGCTLFEHHW